jgi:radical SAM superfamily enzyme
MSNTCGIIFGDSFYNRESPRVAIGRSTGAHRVATVMRKHNVDVEVVDFFNSWNEDELISLITKFSKLDFIGFSLSLVGLNPQKVNMIIIKAKELYPNITVIAGGFSVMDNYFEGIDLFFKGFTEGAIEEIIQYIHTGKFNPFLIETIKTSRDIKKVVNCTHHYEKFDLALLNTEYTNRDFIQPNEALTIEFSRGCIFKCKFCSFPLVGKNKNDYIREKEDIKQEFIRNYKLWGTTRYILTDDTFNDNEIKINMLYEIANELNFELALTGYVRIDLVWAYKGSLDKLVKSGFKGFLCGIETLNERTSKSINKGFTGDRLKNYLIEIKKQYPELHITGGFIIGLPYESIEVFNNNIQWALKEKAIDSFHFNPLGISKDNGVIAMSPFSLEWQNYGYELMTADEINDKLNCIDKTNLRKRPTYGRGSTGGPDDQYLLWKNEHMDFFDALGYATEWIDTLFKIHPNSAVLTFGRSFNKDSIYDELNVVKNENDEKQIKDAADFVNSYKSKKLAFNGFST